MDNLHLELNQLKTQVKEDFRFSMLAIARVTEHVNEVTKQITEHLGAVTHELGQVQAKMARQEERFELMIDIIQKMMNEAKAQQKNDMEEVRARLDRLEQSHPPAA